MQFRIKKKMAIKRMKHAAPKKGVKKTIVKKADKTDDSRKRVSFAKKLTHSKVIEDEVNVSQNFDATPSKSILKTRKRVAEVEKKESPPRKVKSVVVPEKENQVPAKAEVSEAGEAQAAKKPSKFPKTFSGKKKLVVKKSIKEKLLAMTPKERKAYIRELKLKSKPNFELSNQLKHYWEKLRR